MGRYSDPSSAQFGIPSTHTAVRVLAIGDSITQGDLPNTRQGLWQTNAAIVRDWLSWAVFFSSGIAIYHRNEGWAGDTSGPISPTQSQGKNVPVNNTGVAGRIATDVLPYSPDVCVILIGTNDSYYSVPVSQYAANLTSIFTQLIAAGITPIACTITPRTEAALSIYIERYNMWLRSYCALNHIALVDYASLLVNPATGQEQAVATFDGLHPAGYGCMLMGQALAQVITSLFKGSIQYLPDTDVNGYTSNLIAGGLFQAGAGGIGAGWAATGTAVPSLVAGAPLGQWQRMTSPAGASSSNIFQAIAAGWNPGDVLRIATLFQCSYPANSTTQHGILTILRNGVSVDNLWPNVNQFNLTSAPQAFAFGPGLLMREYQVPAGTASLALYLGLQATTNGAWNQWAQTSVINLTQLGIPSLLQGTS